ncbi:diguanylate cyclase domain-containing protein [Sulfurovum sp.]|uniref:GGDEF domain-containing protein n=1 Tax=Sulfurovum sp. TaxID=1969726 RepID=UPI00286806B1|nr:diguanylate cyclase [Sulfurovum sp.]
MKHDNESIYPSNSAVYPENDPEFLRKLFTIKLFGSLGIVFTSSCAALSFLTANNQLSSILILTAVFLSINYYFVIRKAYYNLGSHIIVYVFFLLLIYLVHSGGIGNTGSLWIYTFPALALFLHGLKHGLIDIVIFVFILSVMFLVNNDQYLTTSYSDEYKLRLILSFLMVAFLSSLYEHSITKSFKEMRKLTEKLIAAAKQDQLTEFINKRGIHEEIGELQRHAQEHDEALSVMLCDIDYLHDINERYGPKIGDMLIEEIAAEIQKSINNTQAIARWTGEEFLILLPQTKIEDAYKFAGALDKRIKNLAIMYERSKIQVSLSIGISDIENGGSIYSSIRHADSQMYQNNTARENLTTHFNA